MVNKQFCSFFTANISIVFYRYLPNQIAEYER